MLCFLLVLQVFAIPQQFSQQGRLIDSTDVPITGTHILTFHLYETPISTTPLWGESLSVFFENGYYSTILGADNNNPLDSGTLDATVLYLEIQVDSDSPLQPRQKLTSSPYARRAEIAYSVEGGTINASEISINGDVVLDSSGSFIGQSTPEWSSIQNIPSDFSDGVDNDSLANVSCPSDDMILSYTGGAWTCGYDDVLDSADVVAIVEGESEIALNLSSTSTVNGEVIQTGTDLDALGDLNCAGGEIPVLDTSNSVWTCGTDTDTTLTENEVISMVQNSASLTLALSNSTTVNGEGILTESSSVDWNNLVNKPAGLDDGDDDSHALDALNCSDGEIAIKQSGSWTCTEFSTLLDADGDGSLQWSDCDDNDSTKGDSSNDIDCDGIITAQDCDDSDTANTNTNVGDADCDGVVTSEDCDDNNPDVTTNGTGSENCPASSCKAIMDGGYSTGDGSYWLEYDGTVAEFYCDMTTDSGGWTRFLRYRDSIDRGNINVDLSTHLNSEGYKIGLDETILSYSEILLNGCGSNQNFSILVNIPSLITSEWVEIASSDGVQVGGSTHNSCNRTVERKEGGTWYYGHNHGGSSEFETMFFATQCVSNNIDSWTYSQWAAVDAGNSGRSGWGTTNGIDNSRNGSSAYYNDYICAFVR